MQTHQNIEEEKKKLNQQTMQIFNTAEKPIMEYISAFLEEPESVVFKSDIPNIVDPLILLPIDEYKKNIYIKFTLKTINLENDDFDERVKNIKELIKYDNIKEAFGFLFYCIKIVYASVIASNMINNKPLLNIKLDLDTDNYVFYPFYQDDKTFKLNFLKETVIQLIKLKQEKKNTPETDKKYNETVQEMNSLQFQITDEIKKKENDINQLLKSKPRLGIFIEEITTDQLPKPKYIEAMEQKISLSSNMPSISHEKYVDA